MKTWIIMAVMLLMWELTPVVAQQPEENYLFEEIAPGTDLPDDVEAAQNELAAQPSSKNVKIVRNSVEFMRKLLNETAAPDESRSVKIRLFGDRVVDAAGQPATAADGITTWTGDVTNVSDNPTDQVGTVVLTIRNGAILGTVNLSDGIYEIGPLGTEFSSIVEVDVGQTQPDEPPAEMLFREQEGRLDKGRAAYSTRVLVAYTAAAQSAAENRMTTIEQLAAQMIAEASASLVNSEIINSTWELAALHSVDYKETGEWETDRNRFFILNDGYMDGISAERDQTEADVVLLLFNSGGYCGEAKDIKSSASGAYAVVDVDRDCTRKYSFTHEIGHLVGAEHNPENASKPPAYPHGHGYIYQDSWRTMMAYAYQCSPCTRLLYWSTPNIRYPDGNGVPMGTAETHDNARVLRERAQDVSEFRP